MFVNLCIRPQAIRIVLIFMALTVTGCSHSVRTFFFTGVPEPGQERVDMTEQSQAAASAAARAPRKPSRVVEIEDFLHGPFGAVACNLCHLDPTKRNVGAAAVRSTPRPGRQLAYSQETLCVGCHSEKAATEVAAQGLWQHGPVANGQCVSCHNPHKTKRQYMLKQDSNVAMCGQCHDLDALQATRQHARDPAADCTGCHNPHAGRSRFLLKAEYDERQRLGGP